MAICIWGGVVCTQEGLHADRPTPWVLATSRGAAHTVGLAAALRPVALQPRATEHALGPGQRGLAPHPRAPLGRSGGSGGAWGGRQGREAIPGAGAVPWPRAPGRPGKAPRTKGGCVQTPRLCPPPAARRLGLGGDGDAAGAAAGGYPRPPAPGGGRLRAWQAPEGGWHRRARTGVGGQRWGLPGAPAACPGRTRSGAGEGRGLKSAETGTGPCPSPTRGLLCLSLGRLCLQLSNLETEGAGTPARRGGRGLSGAWVSAPSTPSVSGERVEWREGVMRVLKASFVLSASRHYLVSRRHVGRRRDFPFYEWRN